MLRPVWIAAVILAWLSACTPALPRKTAISLCNGVLLDIDGNRIWVDKQGSGSTTVVFESGFGNDSTVWASLAPKVREQGVQTLVYDRAGLGKSTLSPAAVYSLDNDAQLLSSALQQCGIEGPIVMVGHSYGGAIALVLAEKSRQVKGLVLLDAVVPGVWGQGELEKNLATMRGQYEEIRTQAPELAKVAIPWAEALPQTVQRIDHVQLPPSLPLIDVVAENGQSSVTGAAVWQEAHKQFVAAGPSRTYLLAAGSSHKVMLDNEPLVLDAITALLGRIR